MSHPKAPFVIGVTGKMVLPGYDDAVTDPQSFAPAVRAIYDRVWAILDWIRHEAGEDGPASCLDPATGTFDRNAATAAECWQPLGLRETPVIILSSLAPGTDTIVAEAALDYAAAHGAADVTVHAPLPFPPDIYRRSSSFRPRGREETWDAKQARFDGLLARVENQPAGFGLPNPRVFEIALHASLRGDAEADLGAVDEHGRARRRIRYRAAGEYVAVASHLLLAVYPAGEQIAEDPGNLDSCGTLCIVEAKRRGLGYRILALSNSFAWADNGPVLHIPVAAGGDGSVPCRDPLAWLYPYDLQPAEDERRPSAFRRSLYQLGLAGSPGGGTPTGRSRDEIWQESGDRLMRRILACQEGFNRLPGTEKERTALDRTLALKDRSRNPPVLGADAEAWKRQLDSLARVRRRAADRASDLEGRRSRLLWGLLLLIFLAAICVGGYEHWEPAPEHRAPRAGTGWIVSDPVGIMQALLLLFALAALGAIGWRYFVYRRSDAERERYDLRAFSEGLRVQIAWCLAGVPGTVSADYMQRQRSELDWIRYAIQSLAWPPERWTRGFAGLSRSDQAGLLETCRSSWVLEQRDFFADNAKKSAHSKHVWHQWGWALGAAGLINIIAKFLGAAFPWIHHAFEHHAGPIALTALLAGAALSASTIVWIRRSDRRSKIRSRPGPALSGFLRWLCLRPATWGPALMLATAPFYLPHVLAPLTAQWPSLHNWWMILTGTTLVSGALCLAWSERNFHGESARRYAAMASLFDSADRRLLGLIDAYAAPDLSGDEPGRILAEIHDVLRQLGCDALDENAEWLILRRIHPLEPFLAG